MMNKPAWHHLIRWILPLSVMITIFYFSSQDANDSGATSGSVIYLLYRISVIFHLPIADITPEALIEMLSPLIRKSAHIIEHLILFATLFYPLSAYTNRRIPEKALLITFLNACSDELHQLFIPGRHGCFSDVLIDCSAAAVVTIITLSIIHKKRLQRR